MEEIRTLRSRHDDAKPLKGGIPPLPKNPDQAQDEKKHVQDLRSISPLRGLKSSFRKAWFKMVEEFQSRNYEEMVTVVEAIDGELLEDKDLYLSLALALTTDYEDAEEMLGRYLAKSCPDPLDPVVALVLAKLKFHEEDMTTGGEYLSLYRSYQKIGFETKEDLSNMQQDVKDSREIKEKLKDLGGKWECLKEERNLKSPSMDKLFKVIGLEKVKRELLSLYVIKLEEKKLHPDQRVKTAVHFVFKGNPGVGKTTVAVLLGELLHEAGVRRNKTLVKTDGGKLKNMAIHEAKKLFDSALGAQSRTEPVYRG